jgi:hydroxymethylglutaryl-CoA lyase
MRGVGVDMKNRDVSNISGKGPSQTVLLQEVGLRDGLQNEPVALAPEIRARLIERLADAGLSRVQIGSFVNPRRVPQMAGTEHLWQDLKKKKGVRYSVLVLNQRGLDSALAENVPQIEIYVSASETHSQRNSGMSTAKALRLAARMIGQALESGRGVTAGVMCAFGCFYEGTVELGRVLDIIRQFVSAGAVEIGLADTPGLAEPSGVKTVVDAVADVVSLDRVTLHLHDTRGYGMTNLRSALDMGVRQFDASLGGLGGCPFIPGAKGNISTAQTVDTLESLGYRTGVDRKKLDSIWVDLARVLGQD